MMLSLVKVRKQLLLWYLVCQIECSLNISIRLKIESISKDDEWNQKEGFFADGRLEDLSQLSREIHGQIRVKVVAYKSAWWMAASTVQ